MPPTEKLKSLSSGNDSITLRVSLRWPCQCLRTSSALSTLTANVSVVISNLHVALLGMKIILVAIPDRTCRKLDAGYKLMYDPVMRVLTVLEVLQARDFVSGTELAERLEVDLRTVQR